jgi:ferredoxin
MKIKKVIILPGCISCGSCGVICPEIFVLHKIAQVKNDVSFDQHEKCIKEACEMCPMQVIKIEEC